MIPTTQKALVLYEIDQPLRLVNDRPVPKPSKTQVLVKVTVAGLNPHDQKMRDMGLFVADKLPAVLSNDVVGVVQEAGQEVIGFAVGDRVVGQANWDAGFSQSGLQEYAVLDAPFAAKIPDTTTDDEAATLPTNTLAPLVALFDPSKLGFVAPWSREAKSVDYSNVTLLVVGGGSNCGRFAVQFAALAEIGSIVVLGGDRKELEGYGATLVLDRTGTPEEVTERIRAAVGDKLEYVLDAINGPETQHVIINALPAGSEGKYVRLRRTGTLNTDSIVRKPSEYKLIDIFGSSHAFPEVSEPFWKHLPENLQSGSIKPTAIETIEGLDPKAVNDLLDRYRDGARVARTNIHVS